MRAVPLLLLLLGRSYAFTAAPCVADRVEQQWALDRGVKPLSSKWTSVKMAAQGGGCWEIEGCDTKDGAAVNCNWGCKATPRSCRGDSDCNCNGAWSWNSNGTITSAMDGHCLAVGTNKVVTVGDCTGKPEQKFSAKPSGGAFIVLTSDGLCLEGRAPPPPPPPPCAKLQNETACAAAVDKNHNARCQWNATTNRCQPPPPPPAPQPCAEITSQADCRWSNGPALPEGRDCRWVRGRCEPVPPATELPLPACAADQSCAHNGMSDTPPMGARAN